MTMFDLEQVQAKILSQLKKAEGKAKGNIASSGDKDKNAKSAAKQEKKEKRSKKEKSADRAEKSADQDKISEKKKKHSSEEEVEVKKAKKSKAAGSDSPFPDFKVTCTGMDGLKPILSFAEGTFHASLKGLTASFTKPTPIQAYSWPVLAENRDMVGIAETGSGKTLAFSLPLLSKLAPSLEKEKHVKVLVIAPTRELAMQTHEVVEKALGEKAICLYGGSSRFEQQKQLLKSRPVFVVGTPGRLVDFVRDGSLKLENVSAFVLDEADRMLDLGFEPDIREITAALPSEKRQTIMFSATWPTSIQTMAAKYLKDPVKIYIQAAADSSDGDGDETQTEQGAFIPTTFEQKASTRVHQIVQVVRDPFARDPILLELLRKYHASRTNRVLIFVLYKKEADRVERVLRSNGFSCVSIHGDKPQRERTEALASFKSGRVPLMIATDVAARGLDIPNVEYVINFTFPLTIEDYIHRIGRTGRGGATGVAHTLFTDNDKPHAGELINVLKSTTNRPEEIPKELLAYGTTVKKKVHKEYGAFFKDVDPNAKSSHVKFDSDEE